MKKSTKIIVIPLKKMLITAAILLAIIAFILLSVLFNSKSHPNNKEVPKESTKTTPESYTQNSTYKPGVYTSSVYIDGSPFDVQVTLDTNNINDIKVTNLSESIETMYPNISNSFNEIAKEITDAGSLSITYDASNRYTYSIFINAVESALSKAKL